MMSRKDRAGWQSAGVVSVLAATAGLLAVAGPPPRAQAAPEPEKSSVTIGDTEITCTDEMEFESKAGRYKASGNVVLTSPRGKLTCNTLVVQLNDKNDLETATAKGNVFLERLDDARKVTVTATGDEGQLNEKTDKAYLEGGVTVTMPMERLAEPAVVKGQRADIDLAKKSAVIVRTPANQVKIHVVPKGTTPGQKPEAVELISDRAEIDQLKHVFVATGSPVMIHPDGRIQAVKIWFELDEKTNAIEVANADDNVIADGKSETGSTVHATGDHGKFVRATNVLTLTAAKGKRVKAAVTEKPGDPIPTRVEADALVYNTQTGTYKAMGNPRTTIPPKAVAPKPATAVEPKK